MLSTKIGRSYEAEQLKIKSNENKSVAQVCEPRKVWSNYW